MRDTYCERSKQKREQIHAKSQKNNISFLHFPFNPPKEIQKLRIPNSTLPWP